MIPIVVITFLLGAMLVWALYSEPIAGVVLARPRRLAVPLRAADIRQHDAPIVLAGYDPRWIDAHLRQVAALTVHDIGVAATSGPDAGLHDAELLRAVAVAGAVDHDIPKSVLDD